MDKGTRIRITAGRQGVGVVGTIFWVGENRFGGGSRFGVKGDDGATYWVNDKEVEALSKSDPLAGGPVAKHTFNRGDRVVFRVGEQQGVGEVFWIGQSRQGPGQRLGVRPDDSDEAVWIDGHQAEPTDQPNNSVPSPPRRPADDAPDFAPAPTQQDMPPMDDGPSWDAYDHAPGPEDEEDNWG